MSFLFGIADPDLPIHYAIFYGAMMIKGSLLLSAPVVKHFRSKKNTSRFGPKFDCFGG